MDNRLVLTVLFVTLSWISVGINAQSTMANNMTAANTTNAPNATMAPHMMGNMTGAPNATMAPHMMGNMTGAPNATMAPHMMGNMTGAPNATMAPHMMGNMTGAPNATMAPHMMGNMTGAPNATMAPNMMGNMTGAPNTTMAANATAATASPTLMINTTVETLVTDLSRDQCGTQQLCAAEPSECDPSTSGSCFFFTAQLKDGQNFNFGLAGESEGYIAATLSTDSSLGGNDTTYVCANNNGTVKFFGALLNNGQLTVTTLSVNSVRGKVNGTQIQCTFVATAPSPTARASTVSVGISSGSFNSASGVLGAPTIRFRGSPVDLGTPNGTVTNELSANTSTATTTPSPNTTSHAITLQQSLMHALLVTVGVLGLTTL